MTKEELLAKPNCDDCQGACCETIILPGPIARFFDKEWIETRGRPLRLGAVELASQCPKLSVGGHCSIYSTRPVVCREYEVGGPGCLDAIRRRR